MDLIGVSSDAGERADDHGMLTGRLYTQKPVRTTVLLLWKLADACGRARTNRRMFMKQRETEIETRIASRCHFQNCPRLQDLVLL